MKQHRVVVGIALNLLGDFLRRERRPVISRDAELRHDPQAQVGRLVDDGRIYVAIEANRVETGVAQDRQHRVGVADRAEEHAFVADEDAISVELHRVSAARQAHFFRRFGLVDAIGGLERAALHRADVEIVDPDLGLTRAGVDVQDDLIDVRAREIDVSLQLLRHQALLRLCQPRRSGQLEQLPLAGLLIRIAANIGR
jgi:hypothetical protein